MKPTNSLPFSELLKSNQKYFFLFKLAYCLLLIWGVWVYGIGYDYFNLLKGADISSVPFYFRCAITAFAVLAAFNILSKLSLSLLTLTWCSYEFIYASGLQVFSTNICVGVLILMLIKTFQKESEDSFKNSVQFFKSILALLSVSYLCAALSKIVISGFDWLNGNVLQAYFFESTFLKPAAWKTTVSDNPWIFLVFAGIVLFWEASFACVLLNDKKIKYFFFLSGLIFHWFILTALGPNFFLYFMPCYLAFIPFFVDERFNESN